jgi:hypothetical protein
MTLVIYVIHDKDDWFVTHMITSIGTFDYMITIVT